MEVALHDLKITITESRPGTRFELQKRKKKSIILPTLTNVHPPFNFRPERHLQEVQRFLPVVLMNLCGKREREK